MTYVLRLECIGDDVYHAARNIGKMPAHAAREFRRRHRSAEHVPLTPSVRDLSGRALPFQKDYSGARGRGARGIFKIYLLADGAYEVTEIRATTVPRRVFVIVENGERRDVAREEAERWVSSAI
jgi:hypothetical protein